MIGILNRDDSIILGMNSSKLESKIICFTSRIKDSKNTKFFWECLKNFFSIVDKFIMEISRVGIQGRNLFGDLLNNLRVAMSNVTNIICTIKISFSLFINKILHLTFHNL